MFFSKKHPKDLEAIVNQIEVDLANNYKDNAKEGLEKLKAALAAQKVSPKFPESEVSYYQEKIAAYQEDIKNFKRTY